MAVDAVTVVDTFAERVWTHARRHAGVDAHYVADLAWRRLADRAWQDMESMWAFLEETIVVEARRLRMLR